MADEPQLAVDATFARQSTDLLIARARVGLWILATFIGLFSTIDWLLNPGQFTPVQLQQIALLRAGQLICIAITFAVLARQRTWRGAVNISVCFVTLFNLAIVIAGIVTRDAALAPTLLMGTTMFGAAFLPWGLWPQLVICVTSAIGIIVNVAALNAPSPTPIAYDSLEAFAVLAASLWVAAILERQRRALFTSERARDAAASAQRREAQVAEALAQVGREMIEAAGAPDLVARMCAATAAALGCHAVRAYLHDAQRDTYMPAAVHDDSAELTEMLRLVQLPRQQIDLLVQCLGADALLETDADGTKQMLGVTIALMMDRVGITRSLFMGLRQGDALIGFLHAVNRGSTEPFSAGQRRIAHGIAHLASMTIQHARVRAELEQANRVRAHFVATLSHELRNPIGAIHGYHQLLLDLGPLTQDQDDIVRRADKRTMELNELITATLDLSRFEAERVPVDLQPVSLVEVTEELRREIASPSPDVALTWNVDPTGHAVRTDPLKLKMILRNVVTNALKFTERGTVSVVATPSDDGVELRVADTGVGIAEENIATIFEPFTQAHGLQSRRKGGAGLGLHLVQRLVEVLGGTIAVESVVGRGSTFSVWIPSAADSRARAPLPVGPARHDVIQPPLRRVG